ncbi:MAG: hypothetical protein AAB724_02045 [Patescibacteria group bacterium]
MEKKSIWSLIAIIIVSIIALRIFGIVPNTWLVVGLIVFIWLWGYLLLQISNRTKVVNWLFGIALGFALISTIGAGLYYSQIYPYTGMTREAMERAKLNTDIETALAINPSMLKSKADLTRHIQWMEDRMGDAHVNQLSSIRQELGKGLISADQAWEKTLGVLTDAKKHQRGSEKVVGNLLDGNKKEKRETNLVAGLAIVGVLLLVAVVGLSILHAKYPASRFVYGRGLWAFVGAAMLVAALVLWQFPQVVDELAQPPAKEVASTTKASPNVAKTLARDNQNQLVTTNLRLGPGDRLIGAKPAEAPAVDLLLRFINGKEKILDKKLWEENSVKYTAPMAAYVFYFGQSEIYKFRVEKGEALVKALAPQVQAWALKPKASVPKAKEASPLYPGAEIFEK